MLRASDGRMEWVEGRERRTSSVSPEAVAIVVAVVLLLALVL